MLTLGKHLSYWNWALDATEEDMPKSPLFDTVYGFGGNNKFNPFGFAFFPPVSDSL